MRPLNHNINEIRLALSLEQRFSREQLFAIFANRLIFEKDTVGVEAAAQHLFRKEPSQLQIQEAALIAGMAKSPSHYSPGKHPDHALMRRNQVIDAMAKNGSISGVDAAAAKASPLPAVSD